MRAKEFITETDLTSWQTRGIAGLKALTGVEQFYELYRFGIMMAGAGREEDPILGDAEGVVDDSPTTLSYTDADEDIINAALKKVGATAKQITPMKSKEPEDTHIQSPVAKRKPLPRRG